MRIRDTGKFCPHCYEPLQEQQAMVKCDTGSVFRWVAIQHDCDIELMFEYRNKHKEQAMALDTNKANQDGRYMAMESLEGASPNDYCPYKGGDLYVAWMEGWYAQKVNERIGHILANHGVGLM